MSNIPSNVDLVVVGAGAAGLAAASRAAERGARVLVLEKADAIGGSAALSAGILWTAPSTEVLRRIQPDGDGVLGSIVVDGYEEAVERVRAAGASVSEPWLDHLEWGRACKVDVPVLFSAWSDAIARSGALLTGVRGVALRSGETGIEGVAFDHDGARHEVGTPSVVLATGGFQGDPELVQSLIGDGADDIAVRSDPHSVGDGLRLGRSVGAGTSTHLSAFYGHTLPSPLEVTPEVFLRLTLYFSAYGIVVNRQGRRFVDESLGDEVSNQRLLRQPGHRGVLLWDDSVQRERALAVPYPSGLSLDRFAEARALGARTVEAATLGELVEHVGTWGVDATGLADTLEGYARAARGERVALDAPLPERPSPLSTAPFRALEIQPCITMPFGGLRVDEHARVLDRDGEPIAGPYAAGADAGGIQDLRYVGGIVFGLVFGPLAADHALERLAR